MERWRGGQHTLALLGVFTALIVLLSGGYEVVLAGDILPTWAGQEPSQEQLLLPMVIGEAPALEETPTPEESPTPEETPTPEESPAKKIAVAGHGILLDRNLNKIELNAALVIEIQDAMLKEILAEGGMELPKEVDDAVTKARLSLQSQQLSDDEKIVLQGGVIDTYLEYSAQEIAAEYRWRNNAISSSWLSRNAGIMKTISPTVLEMIYRFPWYYPRGVNQGSETEYMAECREQGVPIPPDWAESGTPWVLQGTLRQNILDPGPTAMPVPGEYAAVWTYSDPIVRGACIALPRGSGGPETLAGIICQSATTGHACFWDNILRDVPGTDLAGGPEISIGWSGQRLVISELKDGSNLQSPCTECHHGDNVFLMAPDDPTWAKVLRGPMNGLATGNFTTQVEASTDRQSQPGATPHPRFIPIPSVGINGEPWVNSFAPGGCSSGCHEFPTTRVYEMADRIGLTRWPGMPPACASSTKRCYDARFQIVATHSGRCLDVTGNVPTSGAVAQQWDCLGARQTNQLWDLIPVGFLYQIRAEHSMKCLEVRGGTTATDNGVVTQQNDCLDASQTNQLWDLLPVGDSFQIVAAHSRKCLTVTAAATANGTLVEQRECADPDQSHQVWNLVRVP